MNAEEKRAYAEQYNHISTATILQDIADTEREIAALNAAIPAAGVMDDRVLRLRLEDGISRRQGFIARIRGILEARKAEVS